MATMGQNRFAMHDIALMKNLNSYPHGVHPYFNYYYYNHQPFAENFQRQDIFAKDNNDLKGKSEAIARQVSLISLLGLGPLLTALVSIL
ncbi:hypothetical protein DAPPUDRAFT_240971 [Daphnia pulex]|uniref:Uncharacterized protein n=1 Tax=Daphnia pulex TaxID=6669 RepID=E9GD34_DAPPU|nr:hypothetical protein DAPPUDRAFT_240971 [Daphnia pulex]|eukprot:EFX82763.1 hypothetical protein DAPPUDRAFT_240971 [Daphnia pulex]